MFGKASEDSDASPSWAAVVKGTFDLNEEFRSKRDEMARRIQMCNSRKEKDKPQTNLN